PDGEAAAEGFDPVGHAAHAHSGGSGVEMLRNTDTVVADLELKPAAALAHRHSHRFSMCMAMDVRESFLGNAQERDGEIVRHRPCTRLAEVDFETRPPAEPE